MDFGQPLISNSKPAELMQPSNTAFDHPADFPQAAAVRCAPSRQFAVDAACLQSIAVCLGVVSSVTLHTSGLSTGAPSFTRNRRNRVHQWQQWGNVVPVGVRQNHAQRDASRFDEEVVLLLPALRQSVGLGPDFFRHALLESTSCP
jgi:hypothetical protein